MTCSATALHSFPEEFPEPFYDDYSRSPPLTAGVVLLSDAADGAFPTVAAVARRRPRARRCTRSPRRAAGRRPRRPGGDLAELLAVHEVAVARQAGADARLEVVAELAELRDVGRVAQVRGRGAQLAAVALVVVLAWSPSSWSRGRGAQLSAVVVAWPACSRWRCWSPIAAVAGSPRWSRT